MLPVMDRQAAAKCPPPLTTKHHWMIPSIGAEPVGICKWCAAERQFQGCSSYDWTDYAKAKERYYEMARDEAYGT